MSGLVHVYTYKRGLLSRVAHDLRFSVGLTELESSAGQVHATIRVSGLRVDGAMRGGSLSTGVLSDRDRARIRETTGREVLDETLHPVVKFRGCFTAQGIEGELHLRGIWNSVVFVPSADRWSTELAPSRWKIRPYRALMGALELQDRVRIEVWHPKLVV